MMIYEDLINATVEYVKLKDDILNTIFNFGTDTSESITGCRLKT